ncbi:MAG: class I SAM-dependent methyltransferase [Clostridia bacterium]|nr:class I SAM-dependent methyltransferase [Clostridia bacterium]
MMQGCDGYDAIAGVYDRLNAEIDYGAWADFVERCFARFLVARPEMVLDLACGTGSMTLELARRGYDMIGVDGSVDMLTVARDRAGNEAEAARILFLLQDMRTFELYGTVGAVTCCLDSVNYLLTEEDVKRCFAGVHNYLDPDGLFLFDVNTPYKFKHIYGDCAYILEDEIAPDGQDDKPRAVFCGWQNSYDEESGICEFDLSLFEEMPDGSYIRSDEHQRERCYSRQTLLSLLEACGFELLGVWSDYDFGTPTEDTPRWYIAARAKKPTA